jgi:putative endonuclease
VRTPFGEIDLVARKGDLLLFVEVKLRGSEEYGRGAESFTPLKQDRLLKSARVYLAHHGTGKEKVRFDLMELKEREGEIFLENWYPSVLEEGG